MKKYLLIIMCLFLLCGCGSKEESKEKNILTCIQNTIDESSNMSVKITFNYYYDGKEINKITELIELDTNKDILDNYKTVDICSNFNTKSCITGYDEERITTNIEYDIDTFSDLDEYNYFKKDMSIEELKTHIEKDKSFICNMG